MSCNFALQLAAIMTLGLIVGYFILGSQVNLNSSSPTSTFITLKKSNSSRYISIGELKRDLKPDPTLPAFKLVNPNEELERDSPRSKAELERDWPSVREEKRKKNACKGLNNQREIDICKQAYKECLYEHNDFDMQNDCIFVKIANQIK